MWSGLCGGESWCQRRCRRTEHLHCDPGTLRLWRIEDLRLECRYCYNNRRLFAVFGSSVISCEYVKNSSLVLGSGCDSKTST
ncbi:hypothetical protein F2P81_000029 [Scophthalmus maximus]|uniref:Uncharacterized protein n=1 Tax=Scophthalmus maximus TaxID=52904 RepID=A0A6A4TFR0_SCOMX|nr:hypothetical protein F2P81_000029 [Scophthalmus maximus]